MVRVHMGMAGLCFLPLRKTSCMKMAFQPDIEGSTGGKLQIAWGPRSIPKYGIYILFM